MLVVERLKLDSINILGWRGFGLENLKRIKKNGINFGNESNLSDEI